MARAALRFSMRMASAGETAFESSTPTPGTSVEELPWAVRHSCPPCAVAPASGRGGRLGPDREQSHCSEHAHEGRFHRRLHGFSTWRRPHAGAPGDFTLERRERQACAPSSQHSDARRANAADLRASGRLWRSGSVRSSHGRDNGCSGEGAGQGVAATTATAPRPRLRPRLAANGPHFRSSKRTQVSNVSVENVVSAPQKPIPSRGMAQAGLPVQPDRLPSRNAPATLTMRVPRIVPAEECSRAHSVDEEPHGRPGRRTHGDEEEPHRRLPNARSPSETPAPTATSPTSSEPSVRQRRVPCPEATSARVSRA